MEYVIDAASQYKFLKNLLSSCRDNRGA
jgi:hypothetical protein